MAVSKRLRFEILRRDNHACRYCGRNAPEVKLTIDHVIPETLGGSDDPANLVAACADCNGGKSSVPAGAPLVADVASDAMRWSAAMRQAADEIAEEAASLDAISDAVAARWRPRWIPSDFANSVYAFVQAGLSRDDLLDLVDVALSARGVDDRWAYFCGCCWKRIKKRQERAAEIIGRATSEEPPPPLLTTRWTANELEGKLTGALQFARQWWCDDTDVISTTFHCVHAEKDYCGDPVCAMEMALWVYSTAWDHRQLRERDDAVALAAEVDSDG